MTNNATRENSNMTNNDTIETGLTTLIQVTEEYESESAAREALKFERSQNGFRGGRVLPPSDARPTWRVQAFIVDEPEARDWLPEGMRRVLMPRGLARELIRLERESEYPSVALIAALKEIAS